MHEAHQFLQHWDLNTGQIVRNFIAHGSQLTAIAVRPLNPISHIKTPTQDSPAVPPPPQPGFDSDADVKSDGSYDPLFDDEPDSEAPPQNPMAQTQPQSQNTSDLSLPGTVPHSRIASSSIPKNAPPVLDHSSYTSYSPDILLTASVDGQIVLWDQRVDTFGSGVGRLFMNDKTPPWCASVRSSSHDYTQT
jgi:transcriptional activator SPT8